MVKMMETKTKQLSLPTFSSACRPQIVTLGVMAAEGLEHCQGGGDSSGIRNGGDGNGGESEGTEAGGRDCNYHPEHSPYSMSSQVLPVS